jgi:hypothetical protein
MPWIPFSMELEELEELLVELPAPLHGGDLSNICQHDRPFGGKTMLLGGDWRQTLPVIPRGNNAQQVAACLLMSSLWPLFAQNTYIFTKNMLSKNPVFSQWLLDIGNGIVGDNLNLAVPGLSVVSSSHCLITATFGHCIDRSTLPSLGCSAILSPQMPMQPS